MGNDDFGWALSCLKAGNSMRRRGWTPVKKHIAMGALHLYNHIGVIMVLAVADDLVMWNPDQADLLAEDWELVD